MKIQILDAPMGCGKTSAIIDYMHKNPHQRYLFVTPTLSEAEDRIPTACEALHFTFPKERPSKTEDLLNLLREGRNISTTHELYRGTNEQHWQLIREGKYVLIIDEEIEIIGPLDSQYTPKDLTYLNETGCISVDPSTTRVTWVDPDKDMSWTRYSSFKIIALEGLLHTHPFKLNCLVTMYPKEILTCSKRTIILTYRFESSVLSQYLKIHNLKWKYLNNIPLMKSSTKFEQDIAQNLHIETTRNIAEFHRRNPLALSSTWIDNSTSQQMEKLRDAVRSAIPASMRSKNQQGKLLITCLKICTDRRNSKYLASPNQAINFEQCYIPANSRATNQFADRTHLIHAFNRHQHPYLSNYFSHFDITLDEEQIALSEMLQWIWRSAIRKGQAVKLYVLAPRMHRLITEWVSQFRHPTPTPRKNSQNNKKFHLISARYTPPLYKKEDYLSAIPTKNNKPTTNKHTNN